MEFENDIFISYAHIDNEALVEGEKGWITNLHRALQIRLAQLLGRPPKIWRDPKLQGNDFFADALVERLPRVAAIVSVISPRYLTSEWCRRELTEFVTAAGSLGARIGDKSRIFKVIKTPVPADSHPPEVAELLGYEFFAVDSQTGRPRELDQKGDDEAQRFYWARLDDLAHDVADLLSALGETETAAARPPAAAGGDAVAVYLAETTFDLRQERDAIKRELQARGRAVVPDRQLPLLGSECERAVRDDLAQARLSIHMVGRNYGIVPEGAVRSLVELQNEIAIEHGRDHPGFQRLVWMPPDLETDDERQLHFIEVLETDSRMQSGADVFRTPLEDFKTALHRIFEPPAQEPAADKAGSNGGDDLQRVYLICDQRDGDSTLPLEDFLFDQGFEVIVPVFEGDEAQVRHDHEENMIACDAALIYYGAGNELWLRRKMRELQKSAGLGRRKPLKAKAVYVAPPEDPRKRRFRTHEALVINQPEAFSPSAFQPFISQLR